MTGPQHYREAERLQAHAQQLLVTGVDDAGENLKRAAAVLADAQVHAMLALASVLGLSTTNLSTADMQTWRDVAATRP
jgi:hypothetical protein